jgi:putative DNA primase/helicase
MIRETSPKVNTLLESALAFAAEGLAVLPLHTVVEKADPDFKDGSVSNYECSCEKKLYCKSPGKHPRNGNGVTNATIDEATIRGWWERWPDANIGIACGARSGGLVVADFDDPPVFAAWAARHPDLLLSRTVRTPGRGFHVYFRLADPLRTYNHAGGEVRSDGSYVVAPPSRHMNGTYQWKNAADPILLVSPADLPERKNDLQAVRVELPARVEPVDLGALGLPTGTIQLITSPNPADDRSKRDFSVLCSLARINATPEQVLAIFEHYPIGTGGKYAEPQHGRQYLERTYGKALAEVGQQDRTSPHAMVEDTRNTDLGNARRMVRYYGDSLRYVKAWQKWLVWDGQRWAKDETGEAERKAKATVGNIFLEAASAATEEAREVLTKWGINSESASRLEALLRTAASEPSISIKHDALDAPSALNVGNGTLDFDRREMREHRRDDLLTKLSDVPYEPGAKCPTWETFLNRVLRADQELIRFVQKAVGYSLTASTDEQCMFFLYGSGQNGKSTFIETLMALLGEYAMKVPAEMLMAKQHAGGVPNDIARLPGVRFAVASEVEAGSRLAENTIKDLTGGDRITARFMRAEWFEFQPTHKLWMYGNHKPIIRGNDLGIWRRIRLIPFTVTIPAAERDPHLKDKLLAELPGILAWAVEGYEAWVTEGLDVPEQVTKAVADYREEMDLIGMFMQDCLEEGDDDTPVKDVYEVYQEWCKQNGEFTHRKRNLNLMLRERGFTDTRGAHNQQVWQRTLLNREWGEWLHAQRNRSF